MRGRLSRDPLLNVPLLGRELRVDVHALSPLGKAVLGAVHNAPFHGVAQIGEAREHNAKSRPRWDAGLLRNLSTFSRSTYFGSLRCRKR